MQTDRHTHSSVLVIERYIDISSHHSSYSSETDVQSTGKHYAYQVKLIPLLEAIKSGQDRVASLLIKEGALLKIEDAGSFLCRSVAKGDSEMLKRVLASGMDPNSKDYDHRTPLHVAASEGLYMMAKLLVDAGASVLLKDRWGNTPLDEGRLCGNKNLIKLLEVAKSAQLIEFPDRCQESRGNFFKENASEEVHDISISSLGLQRESEKWNCPVVPHTVKELIETASEKLNSSGGTCILSEEAGKISDTDLINDGQKLYLVTETQ